MDLSNALPIIMMVLIGALAGTLAARIMKGDTFGFAINALLGIGGGVVGGILFDMLGFEPGSNVVRVLNDSYGLNLGGTFIGQIISATVGAIIILYIARFVRGSESQINVKSKISNLECKSCRMQNQRNFLIFA